MKGKIQGPYNTKGRSREFKACWLWMKCALQTTVFANSFGNFKDEMQLLQTLTEGENVSGLLIGFGSGGDKRFMFLCSLCGVLCVEELRVREKGAWCLPVSN